MVIIAREIARELGIKTYTGSPCKTCKGTKRYTKHGHCVACTKRHAENFKHSPAGKRAAAEYYARPAIRSAKRVGHLRRSYGLSATQYRALFLSQNGVCAICALPPKTILCVDHNHETGKVRGLLCKACNNTIGSAQDDAQRLRNAIKYLETHNGN